MAVFIAGLLLFFSVHSTRLVADEWRSRQIGRLGEQKWKGVYSVLSLLGLGLMVWGYASTRSVADLWLVPTWTRHLAAVLTLPAFILIVAAYLPGNHFKAALGHPMLAGVILWAVAHLLTNTRPGDLLLFGVFLVWAVIAFVASRRRDRRAGARYPAGTVGRDIAIVVVGTTVWAAFALYGHAWLIGMRPFT